MTEENASCKIKFMKRNMRTVVRPKKIRGNAMEYFRGKFMKTINSQRKCVSVCDAYINVPMFLFIYVRIT